MVDPYDEEMRKRALSEWSSSRYAILADALEIRDTDVHDPSTDPDKMDYGSMGEFSYATIKVTNDLDQDANVQVRGNDEESVTNAVNVGDPFIVTAGDVEARTIAVSQIGWMPYYYLEISCSTAPSSGDIDAKIIRRRIS